MKLILQLRDTRTGITVERTVENKPTLIWDFQSAVGALVRKIAAKTGQSPMEVMFGSPPFEIVVKVEN